MYLCLYQILKCVNVEEVLLIETSQQVMDSAASGN
jgi:hypothetical protein